jgi:hypothetical protein
MSLVRDSGSKSVTATAADMIDANAGRREVTIQNYSGDRVWLGIGKTAVATEGLFIEEGNGIVLCGPNARSRISVVCATGQSATVTYQAGV